jgi:hypothetical protein
VLEKTSVTIALALCASCSVAAQKSVRSHDVYCSDSRSYYLTDLALAGAAAYVASTQLNEETAYIPVGVFVASAGVGVIKRGNCERRKSSATEGDYIIAAARLRAEAERAPPPPAVEAYTPPTTYIRTSAQPTTAPTESARWTGSTTTRTDVLRINLDGVYRLRQGSYVRDPRDTATGRTCSLSEVSTCPMHYRCVPGKIDRCMADNRDGYWN